MQGNDVCLCAKIRILKQITTFGMQVPFYGGDVCLCAKIRILKQITTGLVKADDYPLMFVFVQRYEF